MTAALRPARAEDLRHAALGTPPCRIWAITAYQGDRLLGIGGLAFWPSGTVEAFLDILTDAKRHAVTLMKAARAVMAEIERRGLRRVVATADAAVEPSARFLRRLGFEARCVNGQNIFVWERT